MGSSPCTERQWILSAIWWESFSSSPPPLPGEWVSSMSWGAMIRCAPTYLRLWYDSLRPSSHWVIRNPIFGRGKCSFWHSASIQLVCLTVGLQEWHLRQVCILQELAKNSSLAFKIPVRNSHDLWEPWPLRDLLTGLARVKFNCLFILSECVSWFAVDFLLTSVLQISL